MTIKKPLDLCTGIALLLGGLFMFMETFAIPGSNMALGPRIFPQVLYGAIIVLSLVMVGQSLALGPAETPNQAGPADPAERETMWLQWAYIAALFIYIAIMPLIGYGIATFGFCFVLMTLLGERRTLKSLCVYAALSGITAWSLVYIFGTLLRLFLP